VDAPADGAWVRGARYTIPPRTDAKYVSTLTWDFYQELKNMTSLPIIPKGITSVEDARLAVSAGAPAIILSNHGGRHLDGAPSCLQTALAIHDEAPEIFEQTEVLADGGVRYGSDVIKLLALGVKAVGLGRSFLYANIYGTAGVERAIQLLKDEILLDAINLGVTDLKQLNASYVSVAIIPLRWRHQGG
jgi:isopentenyl diphosphate isomerase/L-lactate dehydrogenase-like FMN-dependent dehydrogenase